MKSGPPVEVMCGGCHARVTVPRQRELADLLRSLPASWVVRSLTSEGKVTTGMPACSEKCVRAARRRRPLTANQAKLAEFINTFRVRHHEEPSFIEMANACGGRAGDKRLQFWSLVDSGHVLPGWRVIYGYMPSRASRCLAIGDRVTLRWNGGMRLPRYLDGMTATVVGAPKRKTLVVLPDGSDRWRRVSLREIDGVPPEDGEENG